MKERIEELLREGELSFAEIADEVGCSRPTVTRHAQRLGIKANVTRYDWAEVQRVYDELGAVKTIEHYGMSTRSWDKAVHRGDIQRRDHRIPLEELLVADRPATARTHLKARLLDAGLLEARCYAEGCTITGTWNGKPIVLHLDHINGIGDDNRLDNLRLLCPNCHSQTETYGGRNSKKKKLLEFNGVCP